MDYLDTEDLLHLASRLLGEGLAVRDPGLLGAAAARPQTSLFGRDAYPDPWTKAAALMHSILKNHSLLDGNKRLAWLAATVFLQINGIDAAQGDNDGVYDLVIDVAANDRPIGRIAAEMKRLLTQNDG